MSRESTIEFLAIYFLGVATCAMFCEVAKIVMSYRDVIFSIGS
jgi:hypothetical protein